MLCDDQLSQLCQDLGLSKEAQAVIEQIRSSPPSRRVRGAAGNVSVRYPSQKMGVTIQAESHRNELAGIYEKEHDPQTLEYYDQPPPIKLTYPAKNGQQVGVLHTPDFFVIRTDSVGWEEWKLEEELVHLTDRMPHRYVRAEDGHWHCPPGEGYAASLGFFYRVRSSAEIDWIFQRNLLFLEDYLRPDCPAVSDQATRTIQALIAQRPGIHLDELLGQLVGASSDDVYRLIATEQLTVDLRAAPLAEPDRIPVFGDAETARAYATLGRISPWSIESSQHSVSIARGSSVTWDGRSWTLLNPGQTTTTLQAADGTLVELANRDVAALIARGALTGTVVPLGPSAEARELLAQASPDDFREANRRYTVIASRLGLRPPETVSVGNATPPRTVRSWLAKWRAAERIHQCGYVGLLPRRGRSGNRRRKLSEVTLRLLDAFIARDYETLKQKHKLEVYGTLVRACDEQGVLAPSYTTFARAVTRRPRQEQVEKRAGSRAAYQEGAFFWELAMTTPRHGDRPFEIAHVDHTQLDIELVCSRTGRNLGRPWATFLTDAYSRRLLAVALTFDRPSYRSCLLVMRACVQRQQRLPQTVIVDGGGEFAGVYFETLLARYGCTKKTRPGAQPRFGSVCERLFGTTNTRFVHNLLGNTQLRKNVRQVTKAVDPKGQACWTLAALAARLDEWAHEIYDTLEHPALGQSPREVFTAGLAQSGERPHRLIPDDEDFRMFTLPTTTRGTARLQRRLGVKIHHVYYWNEAFLDPELERTALPVRFDPFDAGIAYAFVKGRWVRCISAYYAQLAGRSEREIQLATAELRQRNQRHARQLTITARTLADFLVSLEAEETLLEQRLRDGAFREVLARLEPDRGAQSRKDDASPAPETIGAEGGSATAPPHPRQEPDQKGNTDALVLYGDY
ncbi:MAG TPA: integrase [Chloroflexota bacterium]|nr:integrase [Chloroflexota bacterium]